MAGCYAREMDDLHRRWLPPEIFADIGIADAAPPSPAAIDDIAAHLAGLLGGKEVPRPPPVAASYRHRAQICGLEGRVLLAYGGGGGATAAWPFLPHSPVQWQVPTNLVNGGGVLDPRLAPLRPCGCSPPAKRRGGGTGVFLPRAEMYQTKAAAAAKSPAKDEAATATKQQRQNEMAAEMVQQQQHNAAAAAALQACPELALPQEWTY